VEIGRAPSLRIAGAGVRFDQIEIFFHRDNIRIDRSANIAIERFVLIPR